MDNYLNILLEGLRKLIDADLTCLIKFDQNNFKLLSFSAKDSFSFDFESILSKNDSLDFNSLEAKIISTYNFNSSISNNYILGNYQYFILSTSFTSENFEDNKKNIHAEICHSIRELTQILENNEENLLEKRDYFHLLSESSNELIFTLDQYGVYTYLNKYGLNQLKYSGDEIYGRHFFEFINENYKPIVGEAFQKLVVENKEVQFEAELIPKVSIEQNYSITIIPIIINGELDHLLGIGKNVSERNIEKKRNEELIAKLKEANRINAIEKDRAKQQISVLSELNTLKNEFISNVSHELRTPLASIIGFAEAIGDDKNLTIERAKEFNEIILTESKRLAKLINDVIDFSELENEKQHLIKSSLNIVDLLNETIESFKSECSDKNIILTSKVPESEIIIYADAERLKKALSYIFSNAVKFTNENGRITLIAQEFLKEVEVVISDTGIGISDQKIPLLFDKFSKVKRSGNNLPGAGFGLVTVKQIIDLHKGLIRVKSEVDKGTSFIIKLPKYSFN
ncbi:MAG: PAS domain-containing sensor histidine kinase [Melioribacteraceae bacterium]|nr:PAS domain-containing sensor histidine kinase [Melioribacteraceae bacterium]